MSIGSNLSQTHPASLQLDGWVGQVCDVQEGLGISASPERWLLFMGKPVDR